jgi:pimeloyl-ACP methyl ester carboxylesterase
VIVWQILSVLLWLALLFLAWLAGWILLAHIRYISYHRRQGLAVPRLGPGGWVIFYARMLAAIATLSWWFIHGMSQEGLRSPADGKRGKPVLCVHGFHMNGTCMWGLRRALERRGRPTRALSLGWPYRPAASYAEALTTVMIEMQAAFPEEGFDIVAHSMGGLIVRMVLAQRPELAGAIGRVVTLGTPHHGTAFLRTIRRGPVYDMMSRESLFLATLPDFRQTVPSSDVVTVAADPDLVVYPIDTNHLAGARALNLRREGHSSLLTHPPAVELVAQLACGAGPTGGTAESPVEIEL